ncbi:MAG: hypothetical protein UX99_C0003G0023 [Candidatus Amesbacteria bacterium GW2011_GWB1_47_26]|uniref:Uncharacterized protein n=1 Tax=Candidatus Amesbacteria bacterium GW2011_GWC2_45_19 TaxID=1618366 RepID=A0A0G1M4N9_9BACT|nr:MAG: hypothetical protein UX05_C0003G0023 [Candidatus Amesbacteria bacterium GW2011_GWC2_45_19]KKU38643.1 MAG: hypothetical protein UX52_C0002G0023 [Candidatus Amesbacteria bacterium GW2011_GWA1_46_35]KKU68653.1 MAG: hypothetical protein UX93_C0006G0070 [Microgenomates group bacterium GW2011_GWC1_47_20]KKU74963.1 MAG: hypothetical protein UX99_C0003G0023 [Candidatus Amesbacteria bacterium GW2011_GWB1_47_26]KKU80262.1 MAG: hypothetical protein UY06_C0003G0024 [Candidatus Amesbacteria bacteriu
MPAEDALLLIRWYSIRTALFWEGDRDEFKQKEKEFNAAIPENASNELFNALRLITGYMNRNGTK